MKCWCIVGFMKTDFYGAYLFCAVLAASEQLADMSLVVVFFYFPQTPFKAHGYLRLLNSPVPLNVSAFLQSHLFIGLHIMNRCSWNVWDLSSDTRNLVSPRSERNSGVDCSFVPSATRCSHGYRSGWHTCELERELWAGRSLAVTLWKTTHWWHIFQVECCCGVFICVAVVTLCICVCGCARVHVCVCVLQLRCPVEPGLDFIPPTLHVFFFSFLWCRVAKLRSLPLYFCPFWFIVVVFLIYFMRIRELMTMLN